MTHSITDYHQKLPAYPGRPAPSDVKRAHSIEHRNSLPSMNNYTLSSSSSQPSTHRSHGSPDNDSSFFRRSSNGNGGNTTSSGSTLSNYAPPSFTDCLAFSPADITHMPPLPVSGGPSDSPTLSRSRSVYTVSRQTEGNSADNDSLLTPITLKRRQHDEVMRTVRERVLSKRRALSYHNDTSLRESKTRASHDTLVTRDPRDSSPSKHQHPHSHSHPHPSSHNHSHVSNVVPTEDRPIVTLPPLSVTHPTAHRAR